MNALRQSALPDTIRNEMARLKGAGLHLLPLGGGTDGKTPLARAWAGATMPLAQVLAPMHRTGSRAYGVRLDGLAVIDCDTDDPALTADLEARFGPSPVHVKTPRGMHLYYRAAGAIPNLRGEGLPVDIKAGCHAYVVGPLSERPDGGFYAPVKGLLGNDALHPLRASTGPLVSAERMPKGQRHSTLVREAIQMIEYVDSADELTANLCWIRDDLCSDPATMPDSEVRGIAGWAWKRRLEGKIFKGRDSDVRLNRRALDVLLPLANGSDAIALLLTLTDKHGHAPGKRFSLLYPSMRQAGLTTLSRPRFLAARRTLEGAGLLRLAETHRAGSRAQTFVLTRLRVGLSNADNVADMAPALGGKARGKGLN
jgi:hypothetical protein